MSAGRRTEAEQILGLAAETLKEMQALRAHQTELTALYGALTLNDVLEVGTGVTDATGAFSRDFRAPYAGVSVVYPVVPIVQYGTAAAAGPDLVVQLPAGASVTGYDLSSARPGSAVAASVVVSNVLGGPFTDFYPIGTANGQAAAPVRFGNDGVAADPNAAGPPTVTVPSIASGPTLYLTVFGRAGKLVVTNSPRQGQPPASGVGLFDVPAGAGMTRRMAGSTLTVYGPVGQRFSYTVFSRPPAETFGRVA